MKHLTRITLALVFTSLTAQAECKIFTSPATNFKTLKGSSTIALTISSIYYKKDDKGKKKMAFKDAQEALLEFEEKARTYLQNECKTNNYSTIYNYTIHSTVEEHRYNFYATYDFE